MHPAVRKFIIEFITIAGISGLFVIFLFANPKALYERGGWPLIWTYYWRGGVSAALIWLGNAYLSVVPDRWVSWLEAPVKRLLIAIALTVVFTCVAWIIIDWFVINKGARYGWDIHKLLASMTVRDFLPTLVITFIISIFMHGRAFLLSWKETLIEAERLKKEQISARYEALKNQVNPHFLFNSLNVLASLVHQDADKAEQFIRRLSAVYRYILESRDRETVPLEEELTTLRAYFFLVDTRFGASLQTEIRIPEPATGQVAPLTLQMLVENALKHNEVSKARPLHIEIFQENDYLVVRNNLQHKNILADSTGIGLDNIQSRYQLLSGKPVHISNNDGFFTVKIPQLKTQN